MLSMEHNAGLDLMTMRSWPEPKSRVGCSTDWVTQAPQHMIIFISAGNMIYHFLKLREIINLKTRQVGGAWVAQLVECLTLDFISSHDPSIIRLTPPPIKPCIELHAEHRACLRFVLSFSLSLFLSFSPSTPLSYSLLFSKINKNLKMKVRQVIFEAV